MRRERVTLSIPADDPRFDELLAFLETVRATGRQSPVPRMLAEWALLGFLLTTGRLRLAEQPAVGLPEEAERDEAGQAEVAPEEGAVSGVLDEAGWGFE